MYVEAITTEFWDPHIYFRVWFCWCTVHCCRFATFRPAGKFIFILVTSSSQVTNNCIAPGLWALKSIRNKVFTVFSINTSEINVAILAQVVDCCSTAPNHYLNRCWSVSFLRHREVNVLANWVNTAVYFYIFPETKIPLRKTIFQHRGCVKQLAFTWNAVTPVFVCTCSLFYGPLIQKMLLTAEIRDG